jgi:hypothetical protein
VFETARRDPRALNELLEIELAQPDDPAELVRRQFAFIDEAVERPEIDTEML